MRKGISAQGHAQGLFLASAKVYLAGCELFAVPEFAAFDDVGMRMISIVVSSPPDRIYADELYVGGKSGGV